MRCSENKDKLKGWSNELVHSELSAGHLEDEEVHEPLESIVDFLVMGFFQHTTSLILARTHTKHLE